MIEKNLGIIERAVRFGLGLALFGWVFTRPEIGGFVWLVSLAALFLTLNGIYGRCYLWHLLDISSCGCNPVSRSNYCDKAGIG